MEYFFFNSCFGLFSNTLFLSVSLNQFLRNYEKNKSYVENYFIFMLRFFFHVIPKRAFMSVLKKLREKFKTFF